MNKKLAIVIAFVVTVTVLVVGLYCYHLMSSLSPLPSLEEPPQILSHTSFVEGDSVRYLMIEGEVKNNLETNADVNVTATFYDERGNPLGNATRRAMLKTLRPGQKSPFVIVWPLSSSTEVLPMYELTVSYSKVNEESQVALEVLYHTNGTDENGYHIISGRVCNKGNEDAIFVSVICTYYDSAGNVTRISLAGIPSITADGEAFFELSSAPYKMNPASYGLVVVASRYEPLSTQNYVPVIILLLMLAVFVVFLKRKGW